MELPITGPTNRFLVQQRDRRWPWALSTVLAASVVVLLVLAVVGWPRLRSTSVHYDLIRLRAEVRELEREAHRLEVELERERAPQRLAERARRIGLEPPRAVEMVPPPVAEDGP